ncbi:MAG: 4Fe-4S dicluster domain-containing protein, partial [Desulfobacteraceae bacterium]|nr:4Fe-4S dicluster domain-containing protein [Desulfobacteraceae bacterium]
LTGFLTLINIVFFTGLSLFFLILCLSSFFEKEIRAALIALIFMVLNTLFWKFLNPGSLPGFNLMVVSGLGLFGAVSLVKFFPRDALKKGSLNRDTSRAIQYDERDNMFARNNIQHHPELMETYYSLRPENRSHDRQIHNKPEFGDVKQVYHDEYTAPCYGAAFEYLEQTIPLSDGIVAHPKKQVNMKKFTPALSDMICFYGGCDVGFIPLRPHHFYSHKGRHAHNWGEKTDQAHKTAIVIVVPMRTSMIKQGPTSAVIQESAQKYVEAAKISNIAASYIRQFGFSARAHNDANYETLCVPLAVESGLGELGRMGIFMHKIHGPCVRLAIITTEMEIPASPPSPGLHMEDFCLICKKCADNCPSGSITHGEEPVSRNFKHWSIDQEKCFSYWKTIGSDCGMCISVCPYTKPDTLIHKLVRFYISRNVLNQRIALFMDDLLYGRIKKIPRTNPDKLFFP